MKNVVVSLVFCACFTHVMAQSSKRQNIIFIMSDDHAYQAISAYDQRLISTPNIDRIAKKGILFINASVTNSICAPSRATVNHPKIESSIHFTDISTINTDFTPTRLMAENFSRIKLT